MPNNVDPSWVNQPRRSAAEDVFWLVIVVALVCWVAKHWYSRAVRFITGAALGYLGGLVGIEALFSGNTSPVALWLTMALSAIPAIALGEVLARFGGKGAEQRHYAEVGH